MSAISYIAEIPLYNISSLTAVDLHGSTCDITYPSMQMIDLLTISSISALYTNGNINTYIPNYARLEELSTNSAIETYYDRSTPANLSTSMGISQLPLTPTEKISTLISFSTNSVLISMDELLQTTSNYLTIENTNKATFQNLDYDVLKGNLITWAAKGFPDSYRVYELPVSIPDISNQLIPCSDGIMRNIWDYIVFFLGSTLQELMDVYNTNMDGITLTSSLQANPYILVLHVIRKN